YLGAPAGARIPGVNLGAQHLHEHVPLDRRGLVVFGLGHDVGAGVGAGELRVLVHVFADAAYTEGTFDRLGLAVALAVMHAGPVQLDAQLRHQAHRVFLADLEAVARLHAGGRPLVGRRTRVVDGGVLGDAVALDHVAQGQADHVAVLGAVRAVADDAAAVDVLPEPRRVAPDGAVREADEHVVLVAVAVDPGHRVQVAHGAMLRRVQPHHGVLAL